MEHKEYKRLVPGAETAILLVHGIVGTPDQFDRFIPLIPEGVSVWTLLLDGHGKGVRDFSRTSMKKWEAQVEAAVEELAATCERVHIVAHSMGTLFAIEQVIKNPKVTSLFLMAIPVDVLLRKRHIESAMKVYLDKVHPEDTMAVATRAASSITPGKNPFDYIGWVPRYLELFHKIHRTRKLLPQLGSNTVVYQSRRDEMVSPRSIKRLEKYPQINMTVLEKSQHFCYEKKDLEALMGGFENYIREWVL